MSFPVTLGDPLHGFRGHATVEMHMSQNSSEAVWCVSMSVRCFSMMAHLHSAQFYSVV